MAGHGGHKRARPTIEEQGARMTTTASAPLSTWRTPVVIVACGCLMAILTFGPRSTFGFFLQPLSAELGTGRDVFAFAIAIQNLLWGAAQPFAGAVADRYGTIP